MDPGILFHGNIMKYDVISKSHKKKEEEILNKIKERKVNYLKFSQGFSEAYSCKMKSDTERKI